jgi:hypothetical protein
MENTGVKKEEERKRKEKSWPQSAGSHVTARIKPLFNRIEYGLLSIKRLILTSTQAKEERKRKKGRKRNEKKKLCHNPHKTIYTVSIWSLFNELNRVYCPMNA